MGKLFSIGRAERTGYETVQRGNSIIHYTCNSPNAGTLKAHNIEPIGDQYGREPREVLRIPTQNLINAGRNPDDTISVEQYLRNIDRK